ncbi:hypothetical protein J2S74_003711 [Evansella vedderi]|uniref:Uncharacterized protein n=1 Tax=Evansella vedderi TaxID=38282 RepID=A0ABT9ZYG7_9BACI|nr:hypothetical protein [Evansella vedderi]MDQ0256291.1 hypothetical protein [Evansella vedderi]
MSIKLFRPASVLLLGFSTLFYEITDFSFMEWIISFLALIVILSFLPYLTPIPKTLIISLLGVSIILYTLNGSLYQAFMGFNMNASILMIFIFVPLLSIPIKAGNYLTYIDQILSSYMKTTSLLYTLIKASVLGVGSIMGMGTVPLIYHLTNTKLVEPYQLYQVTAIARGFSLSFLWSPYYISIAFIISYFHVSWTDIVPFGLLLTLIGSLLGVLIIKGKYLEELNSNLDKTTINRKAKIKLIELACIIIFMTTISIIIDTQVELTMLNIISIIAIVMSLVWSLFYQSSKSYFKSLFTFTQERIPSMGNELSLFIAAGVIGHAILIVEADHLITNFFYVVGINHVLIVIPIVSIVILFFSYIGVLSIVPITVVSIALTSSPLFINDHLILALGILLIWSITVVSSPFSGVNLILSSLTKISPFKIGIQYNLKFSLLFWLSGYMIILALYYVL